MPEMPALRATRWLCLPVLLAGLAGLAPATSQQQARVVWKPVAMALLRVDDAAPKNWQVYRSDRRKNLLLVQIGARFLLADLQARRIYELSADTLTRVKNTLEWADPGDAPADPSASVDATADARPASDQPAKPARRLLPSSDWSMRDVGPAMRIRFRLTEEGREFDVQFPIQPDLRQFY